MMKKSLALIIIMLISTSVLAIKPKKDYAFKPSEVGVPYVEKLIESTNNAQINTWRMVAPDTSRGAVVIAYGDAGNMCEWFTVAGILLSENYDVYMFDYRGFGHSSDFAINPNNLYYNEFIDDLAAVVRYAKDNGAKDVTLFGASMGTIVALEYLKTNPKAPINRLILDSYVPNTPASIQNIKNINGKEIIRPTPKQPIKKIINIPTLILAATNDKMCSGENLETLKKTTPHCDITVFDCGHLQAINKETQLYCQSIYDFLRKHKQ